MDAGAIYDDRPRADNLPHLLSGINMEYIGETHQALEQELDYQTYLEDELKNYVARGLYSQHDAVNLQTLININREHLESLSPITSLEHMFSEISQKVSDRAVDLVNVRDSPAFWDRNLSKNMRACWKTVQRFSYVSRVHISNASEYQMFYYNCDHFIKSLQKKAEINYNRYRDIDTDYPSVSTSRLNTCMTEGLSKFQSLSSEVMRLMDKARRINPVYLRVRGLNRPVSGIMLCDYSTKNFSLRAGQHVFVLNNAYVTPLSSNSDATDSSETSECSTCSYCLGLHHNHHPGCENSEVQLSTTATETTPTEEGTDFIDLKQGAPAVMRRRHVSDVSSVTEETNGPSEESTVNSSPGCSHTFCSQRGPVVWKVRTSDGSLTVDVPAVTVMINERDEEAIAHAHEIYEFFTSMWREAIDIWLTKGVKAITNYFSTLIEAKYIRLENERIFQQFLDEVQRAFPIQDPVTASANKILNEMIETLREKIRRQETREETTEEIYVRITEVATYRKTVQKVRDHVNHIRRFTKDVDENTHRGYIDTATLRSMGDLKYVYEETVEEHRKLERMLRQVNAFRTGRRSPRVPVQTIHSTYGKYYSSAEEYSSESEESQYDVERSKDLSPRILYGREETQRTTALTDRPRHVRRPRGDVAGEEPLTDSSDESDTGKPRRSSGFLYKPTHGRRGEHVSEITEETNDTVISSMTLDRKINFAKQIRRPDKIDISPDERYRSRRQYHVPPGPQKGDVSMVYLQITTARSTQDTMSPTDDNRQSRGIQIDIETIPVDAKDVLQVEPRVASWQRDAAGEMILKHDVSLNPIQSERERRSVPERTMEAIVSGTVQTDGHYERGVQVTSRDEYKGIMKPPMYDYMQRSTQTDYVEPMEVIKNDQTEKVHAAPLIPDNRYIVSSFSEAPKVTSGLISSSLILGQTDTAITKPRSEISTMISTVTQKTVKEFTPSTISVSTEQLLHVEDAWTEATIVKEEQVPTIQQIRTVGERSAPPVEPVHQILKVRPCQTSKSLVNDFGIQARIDTQRMETIISITEEPLEEVITGSEIKNAELIAKTGGEQVVHTEPSVLGVTEVVSVVTSWTETPRVLEEFSSEWITDIADRDISASKSTVTSSEKAPKPRIIQINANTQTELEHVSHGMETMVVEEMMPPITVVRAPEVRAAPVIEPRVSIRYCQSSTPLHIHYEGITTSEEAPTGVPEQKPKMYSIELQAQLAAEHMVVTTHAKEEGRRHLKGIGINTEDLKTYLDAWTEAIVVDEPQKIIVQEHTVGVKAEPGQKRVTHSMKTQTLFRDEVAILSVECPSMISVSTASMTDCMVEQVQPVEVHGVQRLAPEIKTISKTSTASRLEEVGTSADSMVTYNDSWTETTAIKEPSPKPRMHSTQVQAQIDTDLQETTTHVTREKRHQLEGIGINTEDLKTYVDAWTEALKVEEPGRIIEKVQTVGVRAEPVMKSKMQTREIQASTKSETTHITKQLSEQTKRMKVVRVETPVTQYRATSIITESMIEPSKPVVVHTLAPAKPLEMVSTGLDIEQKDMQTGVHREDLLTNVSSVVEHPIRQSEVTVGKEVKYSDAQTIAEAMELRTLVSSWAEEVIIETIPAPVVEAPPPLPMTPLPISVRYSGVQTPGKKHLETTSSTEPTEYRTSLSGRLEAVKPMSIYEAQTIIEEKVVKPAVISTGIQPIEESVTPAKAPKQSSISTEWVVELKDRSLLTETPLTADAALTHTAPEIHTAVSSALQAEPEQIIKEVVAEPVVMAAPPVKLQIGKMQTQIQRYNSTATMTSREFTSTEPEIVTVPKPKVSDFTGQVSIGVEIRGALSGVPGVLATQLKDAEIQVEIEQVQMNVSSHVAEKPIAYVTSSTETPLVGEITTATMTEVRIEPTQPVVVHSIPPAPQKAPETEAIGIQWLAELKEVEVQAIGEVKEKPITFSVGSQVDLVPIQTGVTTHISEVVHSVPPTPESVTVTTGLIREHDDVNIPAPEVQISSTISSVVETEKPKISMRSASIETERSAQLLSTGTETEEAVQIIQKESTSVVHVAPPIPSLTLVKVQAVEEVKEKPITFSVGSQVDLVPIQTGVTTHISEVVHSVPPTPESVTVTTGLIREHDDVNIPAPEVQISSTISSVVETEKPKISMRSASIETERSAQLLSTGTETEEAVQIIQKESTSVVHVAPPIPSLTLVKVQAVEEVKEKPITFSVGSQVDLVPIQTGVTTHISEVVHSVPPTPESVTVTTGLIREHDDVNIPAPEVQISSTISSVVETEKPKISMRSASIETERSAQLLSTGTETEEAVQIIQKESTSVVHVAPPIPSLTLVKVQAVEEVKEKPITFSVASQVDLIPYQTGVNTHIPEVLRPDYRSTATITETMVEPTRVSVQAIRPPQSSPITTSSKLYLDQINTGISPSTMELSTTVSSIPKVSLSSLGIMTELMAVQADGWTQADYVEPEPVIKALRDISTVETALPIQPTRVRIGSLQTPYQIRHEGVTSEVGVKKPLAEVEISSAQCPVPAKVTLETATSQYIYIPKRSEALTEEVTPPKPAMRTYEVQVSLPQAELMSSALEVSQVDVDIPAPEIIAVVSRGVETITVEEPGPMIKPVEVIQVKEAPPLMVEPLPVKIRYGKTETPIQDRHEVIHEQPVKLESMAIANAGIRVTDKVLVRSIETVLSTKTVNSSMQTDLVVEVQSRAVSTGEVIKSPRSPKLTTKSGYMQVQSSVPVHVKSQTDEKYCNTESILLTQKSVQVTSVEKSKEVMEIVVVKAQTKAVDVKTELTGEYIERAKEMTISSAVFEKPAMGSTSTMTEMLIEPTKPTVVFSAPPLQQPEPILMKIAASECIPLLSDTVIDAPSISLIEAVVESVKQTLDVSSNTSTIEYSDRNIQTQGEVPTTITEVTLKPVKPLEVTSSIGGPVFKNEGISVVADGPTTTITSVTEAPVEKVSTSSVGITTEAAPVGISRGTETVVMEVTVPVIKPQEELVTREAPPIELPRLRYGKEQTPKVPKLKMEYITVGTPVQVKTVMKLGEVQAVQEIPISGATSSLLESIPTMDRVQVSTVAEIVEKPKEVVSAIPVVLKATSTSSLQVSPLESRSTATITESRIEPSKPVVVHTLAPAKPLEMVSTGLDIEQKDMQTGVHREDLLTNVSSVVEHPIRQSEVTVGKEVKYSDAQTIAEAMELRTLVSSWAEEVIIETIPAPVVEAPPPLPMTPLPISVRYSGVQTPGKKHLETTSSTEPTEYRTSLSGRLEAVKPMSIYEAQTIIEEKVVKPAVISTGIQPIEESVTPAKAPKQSSISTEWVVELKDRSLLTETPLTADAALTHTAPEIHTAVSSALQAEPEQIIKEVVAEPVVMAAPPVKLQIGKMQTQIQRYNSTATMTSREFTSTEPEIVTVPKPKVSDFTGQVSIGVEIRGALSGVPGVLATQLKDAEIQVEIEQVQMNVSSHVAEKPIAYVTSSTETPLVGEITTATMTEVRIEPTQPVVVHSIPPAPQKAPETEAIGIQWLAELKEVEVQAIGEVKEKPITFSVGSQVDLVPIQTGVTTHISEVVHSVPPTPESVTVTTGLIREHDDVNIPAPEVQISSTISSVVETEKPKISMRSASIETERSAQLLSTGTETEEAVQIIQKESTSVVHVAPPIPSLTLVKVQAVEEVKEKPITFSVGSQVDLVPIQTGVTTHISEVVHSVPPTPESVTVTTGLIREHDDVNIPAPEVQISSTISSVVETEKPKISMRSASIETERSAQLLSTGTETEEAVQIIQKESTSVVHVAPPIPSLTLVKVQAVEEVKEKPITFSVGSQVDLVPIQTGVTTHISEVVHSVPPTPESVTVTTGLIREHDDVNIPAPEVQISSTISSVVETEKPKISMRSASIETERSAQLLSTGTETEEAVQIIQKESTSVVHVAPPIPSLTLVKVQAVEEVKEKPITFSVGSQVDLVPIQTGVTTHISEVVHSVPPTPESVTVTTGLIREHDDVNIPAPEVQISSTISSVVETEKPKISMRSASIETERSAQLLSTGTETEEAVQIIQKESTSVVHVAPPIPSLTLVKVQAVEEVKEKPITFSVGSQVDLVPIQTGVTTHISEVVHSVPPTPESVTVTTGLIREHDDVNIPAPEVQISSTISSVVETEKPKISMRSASIETERSAQLLSTGTETEEAVQIIQKESTSVVHVAPPIPSLTLVKVQAVEEVKEKPITFSVGSQVDLVPIQTGVTTHISEVVHSVPPTPESVTVTTGLIREHDDVNIPAPEVQISSTISSVVETEKPKISMRSASIETERSAQLLSTGTETEEAVQIIQKESTSVVHVAPPIPSLTLVKVQAVEEVKEKPITFSVASQVDLIPYQTGVNTHIPEVLRPDYRSTATITETMVEPTRVSVQAIRPPQSSPITTSSKLYLDQINTGISPSTMELSTTVSSIPKVSLSSLGIMTELMAVQADGWTQADYVEPEPVIKALRDISTVETALPIQPTRVRIGSLQTPYQIRHEGVTSEVGVKKPLAEVEISSAQCPVPAKVTLETATSQYIYIPKRSEALTEEVTPPKPAMRTYEVQVSLPQAELMSSALEVSQVDVDIPAPEIIAVVSRGVETITVEEPGPMIKPVEVIQVKEAPPLMVEPLPVKIRYGKTETPIQDRHEVIHEQPVKLESMAIANAGIRVTDKVLVRSIETVLSTKTVNSSMQTDLVVEVQSRAVSTGEVIKSPRSPKLTTKSGYMQVQSSVPVHVKSQTDEKYCNTESILLTQKSVQVTSVEKSKEVMEIVVVKAQTKAVDVKTELTGEYIERAKEMTISSAVFEKPAMGSTSTMTEMLIEPTKPTVVFSAPPLQQPEPILMKIAASECIPLLSDTVIDAPSISLIEAVVESVKQTLDVSSNTSTIEYSDRNIQTQGEVPTTITEVTLKPVKPLEVTSSIGGPVFKNEGISVVADGPTTTITSVTEAPVEKVSTSSVGITTEAAPVGISRGTETVVMEVTVPVIKPQEELVTREAPPIELPRLRYGKEQTPKVPKLKMEYITVGTPVQVKTVMKLGEVQAVQEIPISGATSSLLESIPTMDRVQVSTVAEIVEKPKEVVSAIPVVLKATSTSSLQVSPLESRSTATITESRIEPSKPVVVHTLAPAKPLEMVSTGLDIEQKDMQTGVHREDLLTNVSSVVEHPIRQSEVTVGKEVKYSDAQTIAEAMELRTLVSSWAEEVIIETIPAPVVEAPPPLPMTPLPISVRYSGVQTPGKKHLETTSSTEPTEYRTSLSGRLEAVKPMSIYEAQTIIEEKVVKPAVISTGIQPIEESVTPAKAPKQSSISTEWVVELKDRSLLTETPLTADAALTHTAPEIHTAVSSALQAEPEQIIKEVVAEPVVMAAPPVKLQIGKMQTQIQRYNSTATMTSREFTSTEPEIVTVPKPKVSDFTGQVSIGVEIRGALSGVPGVLATQLKDAEIQVEIEQVQMNVSSHVAEKPIAYVTSSTETPLVGEITTATMTEVRIEPTQPVVVHSIPPAPQKAPETEAIGIQWLAELKEVEVQAIGEVKEKPITFSVGSQVDLVPIQTGVTTHISEVVHSVPPTPESVTVTTGLIREHDDVNIPAPEVQISSTISSVVETEKPKISMRSASIETERSAQLLSTGTETEEAVQIIQKESTSVVHVAPPIPSLTLVKVQAVEEVKEKPITFSVGSQVDLVPIQTGVTTHISEVVHSVPPTPESVTVTTGLIREHDDVNIPAPEVQISSTISSVVETEKPKISMRSASIETERSAQLLSTGTETEEAVQIIQKESTSVVHVAPPIPSLTLVKVQAVEEVKEKPITFSVGSQVDLVPIQTGVTTHISEVVHSVPPTPESVTVTTGLIREHDDVNIPAPEVQISSTISSVVETEKPKISMRSASIETERSAQLLSTGTETEEAVQIIQKESTSVVHVAPPIPSLTLVKFGRTETEVKSFVENSTDMDKVKLNSVSIHTDTTTVSTEVQAVVPEMTVTTSHAPETLKLISAATATMTETNLETVSSSYGVVHTHMGIIPEAQGKITAVSSASDKGIPRRTVCVETEETEAAIITYAVTQSAPAPIGPEHIHSSTMTTEVIASKEVKVTYAVPPAPVLPNLMDNEMQTPKTSVSESLTMTEVTKQKSINLQTEEGYIWDVDIPTQARLKSLPVETIPVIKKNSNIQCSLMESPHELDTEVKGSKEFEYETIQVDETTYKFTDTQVTETMTKKVPLVEWAGFAPSTGFNTTECSQEFYELFRAVRKSVWDRCVTEELEEYFGNVGYAMLDRSIYDEVLSRCYLKEYAGQTETEEGVTTAEIGLQFPSEIILQEPFEDGLTTKTEAVVVESYLSRLRRGVISESETYAIPTGTDFEIQVRIEPEQYVQSPIQITKTTESFAYKQPLEFPKVISVDQCEQTDATLVSSIHLQQKTDVKTAISEITDVVHVLDEPEYMKTQVYISTVTESSQTEPLSYEYLSEMLKRHPRPQPGIGRDRHDCLHDLDITTYFFDEDALEEEYYQRAYEVEIFSPLEEPITERMPITVRQRVVEYELCDMTTRIDAKDWDNIREVASPITGLFAPVSFAVRQGWIQLGGRNEYIDPTTGHAIPLETALAQGRIRLAAGNSTATTTPTSLMYIEREYIAQETVEAILVLNTETREYTPIRQARLDGLINEDINHATWVLNKIDNVWLTAEEAISQNILRVERVRDTETEEEVRRRQLQSVVRAYHVTAVRPGGEPSEWLRPDDAVRLGLFDRQTGKIAVDWPARPSYHLFEDGRTPSIEEGVSLWCNFLTARQAGWIRLIPEMNINKWIPLSQPSGSSGSRRLLSTAVSLVSSSNPNNDQPGPYRATSYQRTRHLQSERGQYTSYISGSMAPRRLGSDSHSPDYGTEDSRTPPYLTEVGEFEHTEAYTLPSRQVIMEEQIPQLEEISSFRTLEEGDGQFYSYPTTTYATEESMTTVRHEFEETHSYTDPRRGQYIREQSPSMWSRGQSTSGQRTEPPSDYSRSGYLSRSSESEQRR